MSIIRNANRTRQEKHCITLNVICIEQRNDTDSVLHIFGTVFFSSNVLGLRYRLYRRCFFFPYLLWFLLDCRFHGFFSS